MFSSPSFTYIDTEAAAPIIKTGPFLTKYRWTIELWVDDILLPLHAHARTYFGARRIAKQFANRAEVLIEEAGLMPSLYQKLSAARTGKPELPPVGATVYLTKETAGFPVGHPCAVIEAEWREEDEGMLPENTFPLLVWPVGEGKEAVPLAMDEYTHIPPAPKPQQNQESK